MSKPLLLIVLVVIFLGNGLRAVIGSAVFISEGRIASFLTISVDATAVVIEALMAAVLISLLIAPWIMQRVPPVSVALVMTGMAVFASVGLAILYHMRPPLDLRIGVVMVLFPMMGFALAALAPISQNWTRVEEGTQTKPLLGAWVLAMPVAVLVTPHLVRVAAPRYGLELFFVCTALILIGLMALIWTARPKLTPVPMPSGPVAFTMRHGLVLISVLSFQIFTTVTSLHGLAHRAVPILAVISGLSAMALFGQWMRHNNGGLGPQTSPSRTIALLGSLFLLHAGTTGFFDTAFLVLHSCSNTLIADRATMSAGAQILAVIFGVVVLGRFAWHGALICAGLTLTAFGLLLYLAYPGAIGIAILPIRDDVLFVGSHMLVGFGAMLATMAIILLLVKEMNCGARFVLWAGFSMILGTEFGLELFELASQLWMVFTRASSPPYAAIFLIQPLFAIAAMIPLTFASVGQSRESGGSNITEP